MPSDEHGAGAGGSCLAIQDWARFILEIHHNQHRRGRGHHLDVTCQRRWSYVVSEVVTSVCLLRLPFSLSQTLRLSDRRSHITTSKVPNHTSHIRALFVLP